MKTKTKQFLSLNFGDQLNRQANQRCIFCDGTGDKSFNTNLDIELSHWIPNRTPKKFKADSSTEICLNFCESDNLDDYDIVSNNHLDLDGILSAFVLTNPEVALAHRDILIAAAEAGDFWSPLELIQVKVYETLTQWFSQELSDHPTQEIYEEIFRRLPILLENPDKFQMVWRSGYEAFEKAKNDFSHSIKREVHGRFVVYVLPHAIAQDNPLPSFPPLKSPLTFKTAFLHNARPKEDDQRVMLVCFEKKDGYQYDLWYPGYMWADTPNRWLPKGVKEDDPQRVLTYPELQEAVSKIQEKEQNQGRWLLSERIGVSGGLKGRGFPVVLSFMRENLFRINKVVTTSSLQPDDVGAILSSLFVE